MKFQWISGFFILLAVGCANDPAVEQSQKQVTCKYWLQQCHLRARSTCESGYSVVRSIRTDKIGGPHGSYKEYKMLFNCN